MKKPGLILIAAAVAAFVFFAACDSSGGGSVTEDDLQGIWVAVGEDGGIGKAMLFEFSGNNFTRIAYTETEAPDMDQEEGGRGSFTMSGNTMKASITQVWDEGESNWVSYSETRDVPISLSGDTFTVNIDGQDVTFHKKTFSQPTALVKTWYETPDGEEMELGSDGAYSYTGEGTYTGTWAATSDMIRTITTSDGASEFYFENIYDYEIIEEFLNLSWDGGDPFYVFSPNPF